MKTYTEQDLQDELTRQREEHAEELITLLDHMLFFDPIGSLETIQHHFSTTDSDFWLTVIDNLRVQIRQRREYKERYGVWPDGFDEDRGFDPF